MSFLEQRIKSILTNNQIEFEETEHEAVYTAPGEQEQALKCPLTFLPEVAHLP